MSQKLPFITMHALNAQQGCPTAIFDVDPGAIAEPANVVFDSPPCAGHSLPKNIGEFVRSLPEGTHRYAFDRAMQAVEEFGAKLKAGGGR